jgi:hypothetical protein
MVRFEGGRGAGYGGNGRRRAVDSAREVLEVGGGVDVRDRPGSEREREKGKWAGNGVGRLEEKVGRSGKKKGERKGGGPRIAAGPQGLLGCGLEKKEGRERREGFGEFFNLFNSSNFLNLNPFSNF